MTNEQFLGNTLAEMVSSGVTVQFNKRIYNSKHSYNFFNDDPKPELYVNYFSEHIDDWFTIYIHEYGHFLQWKNEWEKWEPYNKYVVSMNSYLDNENNTVTRKTVRKIQEIEIDCEKKVLKLIKKHKLHIDVAEYTQNTNLYIYCHIFFRKYRKFYTPYNKELLQMMPKKLFTVDQLDKKIEGAEEIYIKEFNKEFTAS